MGVPVNLTFSESSLTHNLDDQLEMRRYIASHCFEKLGVDSVSFVK
jgi:hypothetical protein